jgi:Holliday junction resolvase
MTPESKVKKKVTTILKEIGAYYFYPVTGGFGRSGVPDIVCCLGGNFIGIECKAGDNKATALQNKNLEEIQAAGGFAFLVNEDNIDSLERVLKTMIGE